MKRLIILVVVLGATISTAIALATPSQGTSSTVLSSGPMQGVDLVYSTGAAADASGLTWEGRNYTADQLPEFLMRLRSAGVTDLGAWLNLHPAVSAKFGMMPIGILHSPQIVTQTVKFPPGVASGWHTHPGYLVSTVVSGQLTRYSTDCSSQAFSAGQSWYETGANTFIVKNEGTTDAVDTVTFVAPGGTPSTGLRIDKPQPTTCSK